MSTATTSSLLSRLQEAHREAAPRPWERVERPVVLRSGWRGPDFIRAPTAAEGRAADYLHPADAELIVLLRNAWPQMEALIEAAQDYRKAEEECDRSGEWEPAQEAAVILDMALAAFTEEKETP